MNIVLWIIQILLAIHTLIGAFWKFGNLDKVLPFPHSLPNSLWILVSIIEIVCALLLVAPLVKRSLARVAALAALAIAAEMLIFSALHLKSGYEDFFPLYYWLVVAGICGLLALGRWRLAR